MKNHTEKIRQDVRNFFDIPMEERTREDIAAVKEKAMEIPAGFLDLYEDLMEAAEKTQQFLDEKETGYEAEDMEGGL